MCTRTASRADALRCVKPAVNTRNGGSRREHGDARRRLSSHILDTKVWDNRTSRNEKSRALSKKDLFFDRKFTTRYYFKRSF
jgi:hypothetical protein